MKKLRGVLTGFMVLLMGFGSLQVQAEVNIQAVFSEGSVSSKEGGAVTWTYANVEDTWTGSELGRHALVVEGNGALPDYAPELCQTYHWTPVAPWKEDQMSGTVSAVVVEPGITSIGTYDFYGMRNLGRVDLPEGLTSIGDYAFGNCLMLSAVSIPDSVTTISSTAFHLARSMVICCSPNSCAHKYALENGISVQLINCTHEGKHWTETKEASCTAEGQEELKCPVCNATLETRKTSALGHDWGPWTTVSKADYTTPEKQERNCARCPVTESRTVGTVLKPVNVSSLKISGETTLLEGKKTTLTVSVVPADAANRAVTWSSSNPKYAAVSSGGVVKAKAAGAGKTVTITAKAVDGSGKKAAWKIKIQGAVKKITLKAPKTLAAGKKTAVKASVTVGKGGSKALVWSSSNKKYATVTSKGVVKALKAGKGKTVKITAKAKDGSGKKASIRIKIK